MGKPVWVRFVLAPGLTDAPDNIEAVARFVAPMKNVERVEVLPFHQMGAFKWKSLGLDYPLDDMAPPSETQVKMAVDIFRRAGCRVH
jgi:pyruvate formate lyase activating enzyme